jgi:hypothetical protein
MNKVTNSLKPTLGGRDFGATYCLYFWHLFDASSTAQPPSKCCPRSYKIRLFYSPRTGHIDASVRLKSLETSYPRAYRLPTPHGCSRTLGDAESPLGAESLAETTGEVTSGLHRNTIQR